LERGRGNTTRMHHHRAARLAWFPKVVYVQKAIGATSQYGQLIPRMVSRSTYHADVMCLLSPRTTPNLTIDPAEAIAGVVELEKSPCHDIKGSRRLCLRSHSLTRPLANPPRSTFPDTGSVMIVVSEAVVPVLSAYIGQ
jgi:hypothetical protein